MPHKAHESDGWPIACVCATGPCGGQQAAGGGAGCRGDPDPRAPMQLPPAVAAVQALTWCKTLNRTRQAEGHLHLRKTFVL